jgi:hypothetical protein
MQVTIEMPGDLTCDVRQTLTLSGTGTIYDQDYEIDGVDFEMSWDSGFLMTIEAKSPKAGRTASSSTSAAKTSSTPGTVKEAGAVGPTGPSGQSGTAVG